MIVFITGGVKSGKSMYAQILSKYLSDTKKLKLNYIATMIPYDKEDEKRIERHIADRSGWGFDTIEESFDLKNIDKDKLNDSVVLLDSLTALVQNVVFPLDESKLRKEPIDIYSDVQYVSSKATDLIIVSDYIFSDAIKYSDTVNEYLEIFGKCHRLICKDADVVIECSYSNMKFWKNEVDFDFSVIDKKYRELDSHLKYFDI